MMALIAAKSDYIMKADMVYRNLEEAEKDLYEESVVIDRFKCMLARREEIENFCTEGICVSVFESADGYELCYGDRRIALTVYEERIVDFTVYRD